MICTSIQNKSLEEIFSLLEHVEMAEIRLDRCPLDEEDIDTLFSSTDIPLIATCRIKESASPEEALRRLTSAATAGATYIDLEIEAPASVGKKIRRVCLDSGSVLIRSFHDFEETPSLEALSETLSLCRKYGGEIVKIVTTAKSSRDWEKLRKLYGEEQEGRLIAFCMGEAGRASRLGCLAMGAPFTYASTCTAEATAPGQWTAEDMEQALYRSIEPFHRHNLTMPASKSFAQRAIIAAALAEGTSTLEGFSSCADTEAALETARKMGAEVSLEGNCLIIKGIGTEGLKAKKELDTGESGLLTRLMIPIAALECEKPVRITGHGTLLERPLSDANDIMAAFGVMLKNAGEKQSKEIFVPLDITGQLLPGKAEISGKGGSQLISGLLAALPMADENSTVYVEDPKSIPYMFITMDVLRKFGIRISNEMEGDDEFLETQDWSHCSGMTFRIKGGQQYIPASFRIEGDWSSAANFMVAGAVFGSVRVSGLDTSSLQADLSIMDILVEAGACVSQDDDGCINVFKAPLSAFSTDLNNAPDLFPIVAVLAAFCTGKSCISGVGRLYGKESNRAEAIMEMLKGLGVTARIESDQMFISGHSLSWRLCKGKLLNGGKFSSHHDHRMVMALKVASLGASEPISIDDTDCVSKSYPEFLKDFTGA